MFEQKFQNIIKVKKTLNIKRKMYELKKKC